MVGQELDRDIPTRRVRDLEGDVGESGVAEQSDSVRLFIGTAAQKGSRTDSMVRGAPADDLHAENIPEKALFMGRPDIAAIQPHRHGSTGKGSAGDAGKPAGGVSFRWGEDIRQVREYLHPHSEHVIDWFHFRCG